MPTTLMNASPEQMESVVPFGVMEHDASVQEPAMHDVSAPDIAQSGLSIRVVGPTNLWRGACPEGILQPSESGPRIAFPRAGWISGPSPQIRCVLPEGMTTGGLDLVIQTNEQGRSVYFRLGLGERRTVDLAQLGVRLPSGKAAIWAVHRSDSSAKESASTRRDFIVDPAAPDAKDDGQESGFFARSIEHFARSIEHNGHRFCVIGPILSWSDVGVGPIKPWRRGNRPRIARPYRLEKVTREVEIEIELSSKEPGDYTLLIQSGDATRNQRAHHKILMGNASRVRPIDLGIVLPVGKTRVWAFFTSTGGEVRSNWPCPFEVIDGAPMLSASARIALPASDGYERARAEYRANLKQLDYRSNWELRQREIDEGRTVMTAAPRHLRLLIGHVCNIDCIMCSTGRDPDRTPMPQPVLDDLPHLLKFADSIGIQGGEPLMYKSLRDHIALGSGPIKWIPTPSVL